MYCFSCGTDTVESASFCAACGAKVLRPQEAVGPSAARSSDPADSAAPRGTGPSVSVFGKLLFPFRRDFRRAGNAITKSESRTRTATSRVHRLPDVVRGALILGVAIISTEFEKATAVFERHGLEVESAWQDISEVSVEMVEQEFGDQAKEFCDEFDKMSANQDFMSLVDFQIQSPDQFEALMELPD